MREYLTVPFSVDLTNEKAWDLLDKRKTVFFVSRFHFMIEPFPIYEPHKDGEIFAVFQAPKDATQEQVKTVTIEKENIKMVESIHKSLWESKHVAKFASQIAGNLNFAKLAEISSFIKAELISEFKESFSDSFKVQDTSIVREKTTFTIKNTLGSSIVKPVVAVPVYKQCGFDIYLACIDYLLVKYQKKFFGLRKYRQCFPRVEGCEHKNLIPFGLPLSKAFYWKHLEASSKLVYEEDHNLQVRDPDEIRIAPFERKTPRVVEFPNVPTLYQIKQVAFPRKWKDRNDEDWTEEKLMKLEDEEAKDSPWYYRHGPGRISQKKV